MLLTHPLPCRPHIVPFACIGTPPFASSLFDYDFLWQLGERKSGGHESSQISIGSDVETTGLDSETSSSSRHPPFISHKEKENTATKNVQTGSRGKTAREDGEEGERKQININPWDLAQVGEGGRM